MQRDTSENGYEGFEIDYWTNLQTPLEQEILDQLQEKLGHVKNFGLSSLGDLPRSVRDQLAEFGAIVIE